MERNASLASYYKPAFTVYQQYMYNLCCPMKYNFKHYLFPPLLQWIPVTKLGRLVKDGRIKRLEDIYLFSLPIKEAEIIEHFIGPALKDEVLKIMPVQKQTRAGQRTRFKAFVAMGDYAGHVGLGVKCSKEVATAIRGAITLAKLSIIPVRMGYWGNKIGDTHTVPCKVHRELEYISFCHCSLCIYIYTKFIYFLPFTVLFLYLLTHSLPPSLPFFLSL